MFRRYLAFASRESLYTARINGIPPKDIQTQSYYQIPYDTGSGTLADVLPGMTLDIGSAAGLNDIGSVRIRKAPTSSIFYIGETAPGELVLADNLYLTVRNEFRLWSIPPRLVGIKNTAGYTTGFTEYNDFDETYSNQNKIIKPIINVWATKIGWVDAGQTYRTVEFTIEVIPVSAGATATNPSVDVDDGSITVALNHTPVGSTIVSTFTATFPASKPFRYVHITAGDSAGASGTHHYPIWVYTKAAPPLTSFKVTRDSTQDGREMSFELFGADSVASDDVIGRGRMVCYWEDWDDAPANYRNTYIGWITEATDRLKRFRSRIVVDTVGPAGWMETLSAYAQTVTDKTTPTRWYEMENVTIDRMVHYVLRRYSTYLELFNFYWRGDTTEALAETTQSGDLWSQITELVKANYSTAYCDSEGNLWIREHPSYMSTSERAALTVAKSLIPSDWSDAQGLNVTTRAIKPVGQIAGDGSWYSGGTSTLKYTRAPGLAPSYGSSRQDAPFQRLPSSGGLDELKARTGHHWARLNNPRPSVSIDLIENDDTVEPAWGQFVQLTWSYPSPSGVLLTSQKFVLNRISSRHSNERSQPVKKVTWVLEQVTSGQLAQEYVPPKNPEPTTDPLVPLPPTFPFPDITFPTPPPFTWELFPEGVEPGKFFVLCAVGDGNAFSAMRAQSWSPGSGVVSWEYIGGAAKGLVGTPIHATADPYDYARRFVITTVGLYRCDNIWDSSPTWTQVADNLTMHGNASFYGGQIKMSINRRGFIAIACGASQVAISLDYGATWNQYLGGVGGGGSGKSRHNICIAISPHNSASEGHMYAAYRGGTNGYTIAKSTNWGVSWSAVYTVNSTFSGAVVHVPYMKGDGVTKNLNGASQVVYASGGNGDNGQRNRSNNGGSSWGAVANGAFQSRYPNGSVQCDAIHTYTLNGEIVTTVGNFHNPGIKYGTAGMTGALSFVYGIGGVVSDTVFGLNGWPTNPGIILAFSPAIGLYYFSNIATGSVVSLNSGIPSTAIYWAEWDLSDYIPAQ